MVSCQAVAIPSALGVGFGVLGFLWLIADTERGNNRFRTAVGFTSSVFVVFGGLGTYVWATGNCESDRNK
jgi:hypothetical protein